MLPEREYVSGKGAAEMPALRIAIDSQIFCSQQYGGVSRYFSRLATALEKENQHVRIFAPLHCNQYLDDIPAELFTGRRLAWCPPHSKQLLRPLNALLSAGPMRAWKPDLVHETYYQSSGVSLRNTPVVVTVYDMVHEIFPNNFSRLDNTSLQKRMAVKRADHIICISSNTKADLIRLWDVPQNRISVVHLGRDQFRAASSRMYDFSQGKPYILYVANRSPYKNFSGLLRAYSMSARLLRDFRIVAFGGGAFSRSEIDCMNALGIRRESVLQVSGNDEMLAHAYANASLFVYPSFYEGFGLSPLEAMEQGCPVASSNASSMPEVLGDAADYFDPGSPEMLRVVIERMLYDEERRRKFSALGQQRASDFTWEACARSTLAVYRSLLGIDNI